MLWFRDVHLINHQIKIIIYHFNLFVLDTSEEDLSETVRSVSSQMGNKEMSGFTLFAKEMRIKSIYEVFIFFKN